MSEHTSDNVLVQKIQTETQARVDEQKATADAAVADIARETQKHIEHLQAEAKIQLKKKQEQLELVGVSKAKQAANIALQTAKRKAVDTAFASAFAELVALSSEEYVRFFTKHAIEILPKGSQITKVSAPANRVTETASLLKEVTGNEQEVTSVPTMKAGLIVETADGVYDITLERIVSEKRAALEIEVVKEVMA